MAQAMKLQEYRKAVGYEGASAFARAVTSFTGVTITRDLIDEAERYEGKGREKHVPMAAPKAEAICTFLTAEMGRKITPFDIAGLETI